MFVYVWKTTDGVPFYVGMTKARSRTFPRPQGGRNWLCKQKLEELGLDNVVLEVHTTADLAAAKKLESDLITQYGRLQTGTGPLTNLRTGGSGGESMSTSGREALRQKMLRNNPMQTPEVREKRAATMRTERVRDLFRGNKNPAKQESTRAKIKAKWADPVFHAQQVQRAVDRWKDPAFREKMQRSRQKKT